MDMQNLTSTQKDELMDQVKQQIAVAHAQELLQVSKKKNLTSNLFIFD